MPNYRRVFIPGGCYFFTVNLLDRNSRLLVENIDALRDAVRETRRSFPFEIAKPRRNTPEMGYCALRVRTMTNRGSPSPKKFSSCLDGLKPRNP